MWGRLGANRLDQKHACVHSSTHTNTLTYTPVFRYTKYAALYTDGNWEDSQVVACMSYDCAATPNLIP